MKVFVAGGAGAIGQPRSYRASLVRPQPLRRRQKHRIAASRSSTSIRA